MSSIAPALSRTPVSVKTEMSALGRARMFLQHLGQSVRAALSGADLQITHLNAEIPPPPVPKNYGSYTARNPRSGDVPVRSTLHQFSQVYYRPAPGIVVADFPQVSTPPKGMKLETPPTRTTHRDAANRPIFIQQLTREQLSRLPPNTQLVTTGGSQSHVRVGVDWIEPDPAGHSLLFVGFPVPAPPGR